MEILITEVKDGRVTGAPVDGEDPLRASGDRKVPTVDRRPSYVVKTFSLTEGAET